MKASDRTESPRTSAPSVPDDRCGYVFEAGDSLSTEGDGCCLREAWDGKDRCKWHLDADKADVLREDDFRDETNLVGGVFRGSVLSGGDSLAGRRFSSGDFSGSDLSGVDLSEADLGGANLANADLRDADFTGANLRGADLTDANARGATFEDANL
ncbi:pentapeptide repeat-containing protein [Halomicrococcus sp. SG-WS-1]|uniref:pentapeptide repeat-containing protein n=1 Tax=Halomicrococcus sp. SG-WS-1 TaxID=3439057 RepID=UPI003F7A337B